MRCNVVTEESMRYRLYIIEIRLGYLSMSRRRTMTSFLQTASFLVGGDYGPTFRRHLKFLLRFPLTSLPPSSIASFGFLRRQSIYSTNNLCTDFPSRMLIVLLSRLQKSREHNTQRFHCMIHVTMASIFLVDGALIDCR
jgi:hypothetical protein